MKFRLETDAQETGEVMVAYEASLGEDDDDDDAATNIQLDKLTADQLRRLCKNVGVQYVNNCTKFACRKALWILANHQEMRERDGVPISTAAERASSNIVRLVNVLFSNNFYDLFLKLNDIKKRKEHEAGGLPLDFWGDVAEALNGDSEDDQSPLQTLMSPENPHYDELMDLNLEEFDHMTSSVIRKKFNLLLKVRKVMQRNMTTSGEHDSDSYNFVDRAMKKVGGATSTLTRIGCFYFFERCAGKQQDIDDAFSNEMEDVLMGSTNSPLEDSSITDNGTTGGGTMGSTTNKKNSAYAAIVDMSSNVSTMTTQFAETNRIATKSVNALEEQNRIAAKSANALEEQNRLVEQGQRIQLAQLLGDQTMLQGILSDIASRGQG